MVVVDINLFLFLTWNKIIQVRNNSARIAVGYTEPPSLTNDYQVCRQLWPKLVLNQNQTLQRS